MKKVMTILIATILLASGMQVTLDRHYCGGSLAGIRISVTGKMASCGMEKSESSCPDHLVFDKKCCEDQVSHFSISSNYYPEYFKIMLPTWEKKIIDTTVSNFIVGESFNTDLISWVLPPGDIPKSRLTQSGICVFRI